MKNKRHAVQALTTVGFLLAFNGLIPSLDGVAPGLGKEGFREGRRFPWPASTSPSSWIRD